MRKFLATILLLSLTVAMHAQDSLYVYHHGGHTDSLCMNKVTQISHSRVDLDNVCHDDYVVMSVSFSDSSVRQYLLATLDSVVMVRGTERYPLVCFSGSMVPQYRQKAPRRTSLDGDFMSKTGVVDFYWTEGDKIYVQNNNMGYVAADSVEISDSHRSADFFFLNAAISGNEIVVYYPGQTAGGYNQVRVAKNQSQQQPNNTDHIGVAGDCGTAVATKAEGDQSYHFELQHKASYLCFLPSIGNDLGRTVLKKITVRSDSAIAGVFTLDATKAAIVPKSDTTHVITLTTGGESGFVLPRNSTQNTSAYMVIAPQNGSSRLTCEFTVYDTALQSEGVFTKTVDLPKIEPNMVYVVKANCNNYVVDLGLPVKFLNHNMGAFAPEEYGGYYAYGELEDKGNYTSGNYTYQNTPYTELSNIRLTDKDVAHMQLGGNFSIPTSAELNMLIDSCETWEWQSSFNGAHGYKITGKNGNVLFLPAAGYRSATSNSEIHSRGCYRSSQLLASGQKRNWYLNFNTSSQSVPSSGDDIYLGESIRPVISSGVQMTDGTIVQITTDSTQWMAKQFTATMYGTLNGYANVKAKDSLEVGFVVGYTPYPTFDDGTTVAASASADGLFSANFNMPKDTTYYYRAYAKAGKDSVCYANTMQFGRSYVDLGLPSGTKWANMNVGAVQSSDDGYYFAWGEPYTKTSFSNSTNIWYQSNTWIQPDRLFNVQTTCYDAATKNWGGLWMTPDNADFQELLDKCKVTSTTMNGVSGYLFTSTINQRAIFVPKAAYRRNTDINEPNQYTTRSCLASSELPTGDSYNGANKWTSRAYFLDNSTLSNGWERYDGISVRPVYKTNATADNGSDMYVLTMPARKQFDGTTETDTLRGIIRGVEYAGSGTSYGFEYWKEGGNVMTVSNLVPDADGYIRTVISSLTPGTTYHYRPYIDNGSETFYGETFDVTAVGVVDLGLSVNWVNVNLGAENEGAGGLCYRWGATEPYRNTKQQFILDTNLTPEGGHDMVSNMWGHTYRMPTKEEYQELVDNTTFTPATRNGVKGHILTSTKEGYTDRSIFFPSDGYWESNYHRHDGWSDYWASTGNGEDKAYYYAFNYNNVGGLYTDSKGYGFEVRGVQEKLAYLHTCNIGRNTKSATEMDTLIAYIQTVSGNAVNVGFEISENADMSGAVQHAVGTKDVGYYHYVCTGLSKGKTYYYRAYATDGTSIRYGETLKFELVRMVNLGLPSGKLWANVNLGANSPEDFGDYYAWGETHPKDSYTRDNYQYYDNGYVELGRNIKGTSYDAVTSNMGLLWSLPTQTENKELVDFNQLTWSSVTINGKNCWKIKSQVTGDSLILPRAGIRDGVGYYKDSNGSLKYQDCGLYLASTRYSETAAECLYLQPSKYSVNDNREGKFRGFSVRGITNAFDTIAVGVYGKAVTKDCDWTIGAPTATLHGSATLSAPVAKSSYGFVIGGILDVDVTTPAADKCVALTTMDDDCCFSYNYTYDGMPKFFRSYLKVGDSYYLGDIKSITAADLLDVEFKSDGSAFNGTFSNIDGVKHGSPTVTYNSIYERYEASLGNTFGNTPTDFYNFYFGLNTDFMRCLEDGHTLEVLMMQPITPPNDKSSDAIASYQSGGSGISIKYKQICPYFYINGQYRYNKTGITPVANMYYHVVAVWNKDAGEFIVYIDGVPKATMSVTGNLKEPDSDSRYYVVGGDADKSGATEAWQGTITFARIYDAPLTADQVSTLYSSLKK